MPSPRMAVRSWSSRTQGRRRLAYKIKKATHGHYLFFNHVPAGVPAEIERIVKVEDSIVRFLTIVNDRLVEPEENRLLAGQRAKTRVARARAGVVPDASGRRARGPRESAVTPVPVSAPSGSAVQATPRTKPSRPLPSRPLPPRPLPSKPLPPSRPTRPFRTERLGRRPPRFHPHQTHQGDRHAPHPPARPGPRESRGTCCASARSRP